MKLFANWSYNSVKLLYYQTSILKFKRGQMVFKQNSVCDGVYLIKSGQYKVSTKLEMPIISEENHTIHLKEYEVGKKMIL